MNKVVVSIMVSVDGFTEGAGRDITAMPMGEAFSGHNVERVRAAGRLLFGGDGYRGMLQYWPAVADDPGAHPDDAYIARRYADGIPITVISDTLREEECGVWAAQTTIERRADAHAAVAALRSGPEEGDILVFGSTIMWTDLLAHGLVDEIYLLVGAKIVGGDRHAFADLPVIDLTLLDARTFAGSGMVVLHYAADNAQPRRAPATL